MSDHVLQFLGCIPAPGVIFQMPHPFSKHGTSEMKFLCVIHMHLIIIAIRMLLHLLISFAIKEF